MTTRSTLLCATFVGIGLLARYVNAAAPPGDRMSGFAMPSVSEPEIPTRTARVTDFGAVPDGRTLCTAALAQGIETLAAQGGGRLVFPRGIWLTGPIVLQSSIAIHIEEGAPSSRGITPSSARRD